MPSINDSTPAALPQMYGLSIARSGLTAALASIPITANAPGGVYLVTVYLIPTAAGTGGTISAVVNWTDDAGPGQSASATASANSLIQAQTAFPIRAAGGTAITVATTFNSVTGSPQYSLYVNLQRLS